MSINARQARVAIAGLGALLCAFASAADMPLAACDSASFQTVLHASGQALRIARGLAQPPPRQMAGRGRLRRVQAVPLPQRIDPRVSRRRRQRRRRRADAGRIRRSGAGRRRRPLQVRRRRRGAGGQRCRPAPAARAAPPAAGAGAGKRRRQGARRHPPAGRGRARRPVRGRRQGAGPGRQRRQARHRLQAVGADRAAGRGVHLRQRQFARRRRSRRCGSMRAPASGAPRHRPAWPASTTPTWSTSRSTAPASCATWSPIRIRSA